MKISILQKILKELQTEDPNIDYVRGMLETLIEMDDKGAIIPMPPYVPIFPSNESKPSNGPTDEGDILDAKAKGRVASVREMAEKGTELV